MKTIQNTITTRTDTATLGHPLEQCIFFDIETTGLSPRASSLYLIGSLVYNPKNSRWEMTQWFANTYRDEAAMILQFLETLEQYTYLYHFNGKTFDIPYILQKCGKYHIELSEHNRSILQDTSGEYSIDLLTNIRPLKKKLGIPKAGQTDLERWLGCVREDTYSGGDLIPVYSQYMQDRLLHPEHAEELEHFLLLHNHDDMEGMLTVCRMLHYRHLFEVTPALEQQLQVTEIKIHSSDEKAPSHIDIYFRHHAGLPKSVSVSTSYPVTKDADCTWTFPEKCHLELDADTGCLHVQMVSAELKYFLPNPKDYYYLPSEDQAVHKSIASFVEPSHRKKATSATCYIRKQGIFLPSLHSHKEATETNILQEVPVFAQTYRDKRCFYELPSSPEPKDPFWREYLIRELRAW